MCESRREGEKRRRETLSSRPPQAPTINLHLHPLCSLLGAQPLTAIFLSLSLSHTHHSYFLLIQPPIFRLTPWHIMVGIFRKSAPQSTKSLNICLKKKKNKFYSTGLYFFSCSLLTLNPYLTRTQTIRLTQVLLYSPGCMCAGQIR